MPTRCRAPRLLFVTVRRVAVGPQPANRQAADKAEGEVSVVLLLDGGSEVEVRLPGRFKVSPQVAGAIKAVPGVVDVQSH